MKTFDYSYDYGIPAPTATIILRTIDSKRESQSLMAIIDSGADTTIVPLRYLKPLKVKPEYHGNLVSQWGDRFSVGIYLVHIQIGDMTVEAIDVAGDPNSDEVILGRNVLNKLRVVLDGLGEVVEIDDYST